MLTTKRDPALYDAAAHRALALVKADPYNPYALRHLVRALGVSHPDLAEEAIARFETVFGDGVLAGYNRGDMLVSYAWDGRTGGWASEVTPEQWRLFEERLPRAKADLERVVRADPRVWQASDALIGVAMGMGLGDDYAEACFQRATDACPTDRYAYSSLEYYYTPKWGGSTRQMLNVGRRAAASGLYQADIPPLLFRTYVETTEGMPPEVRQPLTRDMLLSPDVRSEIEAMLDGAVKAGVDSAQLRTIRLVYAYWDNDRETVGKLLEQMAGPDGDYDCAYDYFATEQLQEIRDWEVNPLPPLLNAARARRLNELDQLARDGADLNQVTEDGRTALHVAASFGNYDVITWLAEAGADVNARDATGATPLITACAKRKPKAVQRLLQAKADISLADEEGSTALHQACRHHDPESMALLLDHGADAGLLNKAGDSPLLLAVRYDRGEPAAEVLLQHKADPSVPNAKGQTPLHYAAAYGYTADALALIEHGADVNARDDDGITPLHWAAGNGQLEAVRMLLEHGADVGARDRWQRTPLMQAAEKGAAPVVKLLLAYGAAVDAANGDKWTPLHYAARLGYREAAEALLDAGADINSRDKDGTPPLHKCAYADSGGPETAETLIQHGADVSARDRWQTTALHAAASEGDVAMARLLLDHGADLEARQQSGRTPLWTAVSFGQVEMVRFLASMGADLNAADQWDLTPLHAAADKGQTEAARALLELGADPHALNNDKLTPADLAEKTDHPAVAALLRAAAPTAPPAAGG